MIHYFASDLHLDPARPAVTRRCLAFLAQEARSADALYLLGDLFEAWVGDDDPQATARELAQTLARLSAGGTAVFLQGGNRDFLLGTAFARDCGAVLLPDPALATIHGRRVLLTHGDALCVDDRPYQRLRALVRDATVRRGFLSLDVERRRTLAGEARDGSRAHVDATDAYLMDANDAAIVQAFRASGAEMMIHGHTHRPAIHEHDVDGRRRVRAVLGDWHERGTVLRWDPRGYELATWA